MKASKLILIMCIGLMCITGFGKTTADLIENSTTEEVHMDDSAKVVMVAEFEEIQMDVTVNKEADHVFTSGESHDAISMNSFATQYQFNLEAKVGNSINGPLDVGWRNCQDNILTPDNMSDPGGVLLTFYI